MWLRADSGVQYFTARTLHRNNFSKESVITWVTDSSHYDFSLPRHNSPACPVVHKYIAGLKTLSSAPAHGTEPVPAAESIALTLLVDSVVHKSDTNDWRNMALGVSKKPALVIPLYVTARDFLTKRRVRDAQFPLDFKRTWEPNLILFLYRSRSRSTKETTERMLESSSGLKVLAIARGNTRCMRVVRCRRVLVPAHHTFLLQVHYLTAYKGSSRCRSCSTDPCWVLTEEQSHWLWCFITISRTV